MASLDPGLIHSLTRPGTEVTPGPEVRWEVRGEVSGGWRWRGCCEERAPVLPVSPPASPRILCFRPLFHLLVSTSAPGSPRLSSRGIVMRRELLIIYCISLCTVLTSSSNSFYISNFTVKRFAGEDSRNSLKSLPWVCRTYPPVLSVRRERN